MCVQKESAREGSSNSTLSYRARLPNAVQGRTVPAIEEG
jgi:hypothetical protein